MTSQTVDSSDIPVLEDPMPSIGQYHYDDFEEVLRYIKHFSESLGGPLGSKFHSYLNWRQYYIDKQNDYAAEMIENLIKNHIGIERFLEENPEFLETHQGEFARFHEGKFLGWRGENDGDIHLQGVIAYQI